MDKTQRALRLASRIYAGGEVTTEYIRATFGVSKATAKRDLRCIAEHFTCQSEFTSGNRRRRVGRSRQVFGVNMAGAL